MLVITQRIRVDWGHCDPAGIIFNPNYFIWMDASCHNLFKAAGVPFVELIATSSFIGCPLIKNETEFLKPAFYDDVITLSSKVIDFGNTSFRLHHRFTHSDEELAIGREIRVWAYSDQENSGKIRAKPIPDEIRHAVSVKCTIDVTV